MLPVLDGDRLVARIDLAMDRKRNALVAHAVHAEPNVPRGKRLPQAIRRELERLAAWRGATNVEVLAAPAAWLRDASRIASSHCFPRPLMEGLAVIGSWASRPHEGV